MTFICFFNCRLSATGACLRWWTVWRLSHAPGIYQSLVMQLCNNSLSMLQMTQHTPLHVTLIIDPNRWRLRLINRNYTSPCKDSSHDPWISVAPYRTSKETQCLTGYWRRKHFTSTIKATPSGRMTIWFLSLLQVTMLKVWKYFFPNYFSTKKKVT